MGMNKREYDHIPFDMKSVNQISLFEWTKDFILCIS